MRPPFTAYLAALAIFIQCVFVQAHVDFSSRVHPAIVAHTWGREADAQYVANSLHRDGAPASGACLICREAALVSGAMPGTAPVLSLLARRHIASAAATYASPPSIRLSHAWRSRAPPILI